MPNNNETIRIVLTGGGSGGHIYPLIAVAEEISKTAIKAKRIIALHYLGPKDEWSERLKSFGVKIHPIMGAKIRRYFSPLNFFDFFKFFIGSIEALGKLLFLMPDVIFSKGGTGGLAVVVAGWFYRIPIIIHESDSVAGVTNSMSTKFASRVCVSFETTLRQFDPKKTIRF